MRHLSSFLSARLIAGVVALLGALSSRASAPVRPLANSLNQFGLELHRQTSGTGGNACLSPYSLQAAFAMTYAGSAGQTRREMAAVLHFPTNEPDLHEGFATLQRMFADCVARSAAQTEALRPHGDPGEPLTLAVANRLFGRQGAQIQAPFLALTRDRYGAPLETLDFARHTEESRAHINGWVADHTRRRILDLIPPGSLPSSTELVLVNALYFKSQWASPFSPGATRPEPFRVPGQKAIRVPTMTQEHFFGYARKDGYTVVTLPYAERDLQFVVLLPDSATGLPELERRLQAADLGACTGLPERNLQLHLPRFRLHPPSLALKERLKTLGLRTAFSDGADFSRMFADSRAGDFKVSEVFHKTFLELDERGTEAAAATAVIMVPSSAAPPRSEPLVVRVDRPFLFALQHVPSSACLFLGRVTDPR